MKECLICKRSLGWLKFKCIDGYVCKYCYKQASANYTQTIKSKTKAELSQQLGQVIEREPDSFEISRRINQYILFDDQQKKLCLPHHEKYTKENLRPEIYSFSAIKFCQMIEKKIEKNSKKKQILGSIKVSITFDGAKPVTREILLIPNYINCSSILYKTMKSLAEKIVKEINHSKKIAP